VIEVGRAVRQGSRAKSLTRAGVIVLDIPTMPRTPENPRPRRVRPMLSVTVSPDVETTVRARAAAAGVSVSSVADAALRAGLGLLAPPVPA